MIAPGVPNVYAAADLAQGRDPISGESELVANRNSACEQGRVAGINMAGGEIVFAGSVPENITTLCGAPVASIGFTKNREGDVPREVTYLDGPGGAYRKLLLCADALVAAVLLRDIQDAGVLRRAIVSDGQLWPSAEACPKDLLTHAERPKACLQGCV
jgi:NAD(P)H-nitrite reductase large subunit